tara:strand:- start:249 stop:470 length:222 start_codon:yes stop_codon:yes gene_type:complete
MSQIIKFFNAKKSIISLIYVLLFFSHCGFIDSNNYSFYETFINPEASDLTEEFDSGSENPDLDSVPKSVDIDG